VTTATNGASETSLVTARTPELRALLNVLNEALTAELVCAFRRRENRRWYAEYSGRVSNAEDAARCSADFELADRLAERIVQLGGHPEFALDLLEVSGQADSNLHASINDRLSSDLAAERIAAALHQEIMARLGTTDSTTSGLLYEFLLADEVHLSSLSELWWSCQRGPEDQPVQIARGR
jgi:bacterioferritin